jgi:energy-coupling factor transporter ATP-binding protein EcfA2
MVGAALQRRVWFGGLDAHPVFPNQYMTFIGPAGSGKSMIMTAMKNIIDIKSNGAAPEAIEDAELLAEGNRASFDGNTRPLVYIAPNSTTFEQITQETSKVAYLHRYVDPVSKLPKTYTHSSIVFILDEITSIFKKHSEDLTNYLLEAYNGGKKYVRKLKHGGTDYCTNICVSLLGNTTDDKFRSMQNVDVLTDGFMSRSVVVWGQEKRFGVFLIPELELAQVEARDRLQAWMRKLSLLFGPVQFTPEAKVFCETTFVGQDPKLVTNKHPMLRGYYERKNLHFMKILLAVHFAESTDMIVTLEECHKTLALLEAWEKDMHLPFVGLGRNETAKVAEQIAQAIKRTGEAGMSRKSIYVQFYSACKTLQEFEAIMKELHELGRIKEKRINNVVYYTGG